MTAKASEHYQTQQIMTASPAQLVFMLYDKAINCLKEAIRAIEAGEIEARWRANKRAVDIVTHLQITLNMEAGGEISENLDRLYGFILRRLLNVDLKNDAGTAREVIKLLEPLRESWRQVADQGEGPARQAAAAAQAAQQHQAATTRKPTPPAQATARNAGDGATDDQPKPITISA